MVEVGSEVLIIMIIRIMVVGDHNHKKIQIDLLT